MGDGRGWEAGVPGGDGVEVPAALALGNLALLSPRPAVSIGACRPLGTAGPLQPCSGAFLRLAAVPQGRRTDLPPVRFNYRNWAYVWAGLKGGRVYQDRVCRRVLWKGQEEVREPLERCAFGCLVGGEALRVRRDQEMRHV